MARLIDADALHWRMGVNQDDEQIFYVTGEDIDAAPTIDPESLRPTAHWECLGEAEAPQLGSKYAASYCSRCKGRVRCRSNYCPHCGAKMEDCT